MKIVSINYFNRVLDKVALEAYKQTADMQKALRDVRETGRLLATKMK